MNPQISLEDALAELYSQEDSPGQHPDEQQLVDYQAGILGPEDAAALANHLAACGECCRFVLAAKAFEAPMEELPAWNTAEVAEDFQLLQERLEGLEEPVRRDDRPPTAPGMVVEMPRKTAWWASPSFGLGLAATLLFVVIGLQVARGKDAVRLAELEAWKAEANRWSSNVEVHSLDPWGSVRGRGDLAEVRGGDVVLLYMGGETAQEGAYLEVSAEAGTATFRVDALEGLDEGVIRLRLPRDTLTSQVYRLDLKSVEGVVLKTYRLEVVAAGD